MVARILEHSGAGRGPHGGDSRTRVALSRDELLLLAELPGKQVVIESLYGNVVIEHDTYVYASPEAPNRNTRIVAEAKHDEDAARSDA